MNFLSPAWLLLHLGQALDRSLTLHFHVKQNAHIHCLSDNVREKIGFPLTFMVLAKKICLYRISEVVRKEDCRKITEMTANNYFNVSPT